MEADEPYDAIVIGSGQGGIPLSIALAKAGLKTAIIERNHVGGTCVLMHCLSSAFLPPPLMLTSPKA